MPAKATVDVSPGTTVTVRTPGVGYGDPVERDLEATAADLADEKVTDGSDE